MSSVPWTPGRGRGRGGFAPRRGRGGSSPAFVKRELIKPDIEKYPLGSLIELLHVSSLEAKSDDTTPGISHCQYVASYNWLNENTPTIIVPGKPPRWTPLATPRRLSEDSGQYYRDPNAAMFDLPLTPAVKAVLDIDSPDQRSEIDVFACGSTLGNLLRLVRGLDKPFRFDIELIGNTVFFIRKENDPKELIKDVRGFGHTFPEAYTTWEKETKGSETHQRIVQYKLGNLECMVRFECDGYIQDTSTLDKSEGSRPNGHPNDVDLLDAFQKTAITPSFHSTLSMKPDMDLPTIKQAGSYVSQSSIFDLKTRSGRYNKEINMYDIYPQLWIKQVPNFIVAYHDGAGLFQDIRVQDVRKDVQDWETENIDAIRRLTVLLNRIIEIAKRDKGGLLEAYCAGTDRLEIRVQHGGGTHALPAMLRSAWVGENESHVDDSGIDLGYKEDSDFEDDSSDEEEKDFTACSAEDCGYCGRCTY
ncbi:hypothetical protein P153DRAFT_376859 [Dothidotthia symphoricarpi CBS 119687]|uniref:Geranylgeranyl pyrophosphate synthetase n=1 Tax=Dothidotthia symphoricarpi CBS 119687 TaxID=1392245 RepID=A0A6A6A9Q9_9PLEO|nr:uncharacterized protein P153DRAFT_376859 [Dothidotthia symphoricarpi CBS 119687]KAF2127933.1 hypothetical protein P153DRAFT_376859 [Dothidotthia symphoricarpi CBS 119687]